MQTRWTADLPTAPGYYWLRTPNETQIVEVRHTHDNPAQPLEVWYFGYDYAANLKPGHGYNAHELTAPSEWIGPLARP